MTLKSWLFQITANECKKLLKQKSIYLSDASWQELAAAEDGYLTPEIQDELSQLSEPERRVITLSVFGGYTSREIAGILKNGKAPSVPSKAGHLQNSARKMRTYKHKEVNYER